MGILDKLGLGSRTLDMLANPMTSAGIKAPWTEDNLSSIVIAEGLGLNLDNVPLARSGAIAIPAVSKARNLLVSAIAKLPLRAIAADGSPVEQPSWLYRTDNNVTPYERMAWTVDDLIFYGYSLWLVERGANDGSGRRSILKAEYCPMSMWKITDGRVLVDDKEVSSEDVIFFNSPFEGLLNIGSRTLRGARDQEAAWVGRARNPIPLIELHQTDDSLEPEEVGPFVKAWSDARRAQDGAVGSTPPGLEIRVHGTIATDLFVEGRNAVRTDVGSFLNIRASMLDGTMGIDSLTYSTTEGERNSFYEFDLPFWTDPIEARLSMDDIVPRGQRIRFDKTELYSTPTPTGAPVGD